MNLKKSGIFVFAILASILGLAEGAIMSEETRLEKLQAYQDLLDNEIRPIELELLEQTPSPFQPGLGREVKEERVEIVLTDEELLEKLSNYINPTGIFSIGGEYIIIFKEKKLKVGSEFGIAYEGKEYLVKITEITSRTYTVQRGVSELQLKLK